METRNEPRQIGRAEGREVGAQKTPATKMITRTTKQRETGRKSPSCMPRESENVVRYKPGRPSADVGQQDASDCEG